MNYIVEFLYKIRNNIKLKKHKIILLKQESKVNDKNNKYKISI